MIHAVYSNRDWLRHSLRVAFVAAVLFSTNAPAVKADTAVNTNLPAPLGYKADWRWVKGAVFVPTKDVNEAQQWDEYDSAHQ